MNKKLLVGILSVSVIVNLVAVFTLASYWRTASHPRLHPPPPTAINRDQAMTNLKERFRLTDVQMDTMRVLHEFRHTNLRPIRDRLDAKQSEMLVLLQAKELNRERIDLLLYDILALRDSLETGALDVMLRMRNVLTPEQLTQLPELFNDLQRVGQKREPGEQPPPGKFPEGPDHK